MARFVGIDGGGTKTVCAVSDGTRVLARTRAGSCKSTSVGAEAAAENLRKVIREALSGARASAEDVGFCCAGVAGVSFPEVRSAAEQVLREFFGERSMIVGDDRIALEAAFPGTAGAIVISGTGSIALGRNEQGVFERAGGLGPEISDEGSGGWIGRRAVKAKLVNSSGAASAQEFAVHVPQVLQEERAGNAVATKILVEAGNELARLAISVIERLGPSASGWAVRGAGGVLEHSETVRGALATELSSRMPNARYDSAIVEPVLGALYMAAQASGPMQ